ncbi:RNA 2',3'-cyclic phosphodiesterase [Candidatus Nitrosocosmicus oleophilus]|uniref:RNA 2',3'-cyclic phosphodiesterase n=1 Tax=Candidatus Nitrosocosmicus oleophilus TaxID=1353260 RepID=UPI0018CB09AA|nr:RNA 2',3'-cyclic phosphodiesterase [Candidatus Nitrosocosmicus oleophilus]
MAIDIPKVEKIIHIQNQIMKQYEFVPHDVRLINKYNLHLTIMFLGEKTDFEVREIITNLKSLDFDPFEIRFTNVGCFPKNTNPSVIWLGLDNQSSKKLNDLYDAISKLLQKNIGYGKETRKDSSEEKSVYVPHLTIFRINRHSKSRIFFDPIFQFDPFSDEICQIKLKRSMLTADGPKYSDLFTIDARA